MSLRLARRASMAGRGVIATAISFTDVGGNNSKTAATTLTFSVPAGGLPVGAVVVVRAGWDNTGTGTTSPTPTGSVTDDRGNTYTKRIERGSGSASGSGCVGALFTTTLTTALLENDLITLTLSASVTTRMMAVHRAMNAAVNTSITPVAAHGVSANPSVSITPTAINQAVLAVVVREHPTTDPFTQDADTTNGVWEALVLHGSQAGNAFTNISSCGAYKVVTASGAQSYDPTITSTDWVALAMVFNQV